MSALSNIEGLLQDLNEHRPEGERKGTQTNIADAKSLATDIATLAMSDVPEEDLDYASSLLLHPEQGILGFLRANVQTRDTIIVSAETILLEFLVSYIPKARRALQPHAKNIKSCCLTVSGASSSRVRSAAIDVLATIMNCNQSFLDARSLNPEGVFQKYFREFALPVTKTPSTVKGRILNLLGTIAKYYPEEIDQGRFKTLERWCLTTLDNQLHEQEKANNNLLSGVINGLDAIASCPNFSISSGSNESNRLYRAIKTMLDIPEELARYSVPIAALEFFANHANLFGDRIVEDGEALYTLISALCGHRNRDLSKLGYRAMESLLQQVATTLAARSAGRKERQVFLFYLKIFMEHLRSDLDQVDFRNLSVAIRGVGYFAKAYHKYLKTEDIKTLLDNLVQLSSWFYSQANSDQERLMAHLPSFIHAYNQFAKYLDTIPTPFMRTILSLVDVFVANYTRLSTYAKLPGTIAVRSLLMTFYYKGEGVLRNFLSGLFYNALVYTCSDVAPLGADDHRAFMDYIYLWDTLLQQSKSSSSSDQDRETIHDEKNNQLFEAAMFDEFLSAVLQLVKAFNLDVTRTGDQEDTSDQTATNADFVASVTDTLRPVNEKDFVLFQNLVDFWSTLLPRLDNNRFREWIRSASSALINLSLQKPLISGFYTMLSAILSVADKTGVFVGMKQVYKKQISAQQQGDFYGTADIPEAQTDVYAAFLLFRDFLQEVWHKLQQFKDELLASCLRLVLASPLTFFDVQELIPPIRTALNLGLTYYPLATIALDALDQLVDPDAETSKDLSYLAELLPCMNDYLLMELKSTKKFESTGRRKVALSRSVRKQQQIHQKPTAELLGLSGEEYTSLRDLQLRIMRFLGRIGGANKVMLNGEASPTSNTDTSKEILAWDPDRKLKLRIPFENAKIEITFDELLPRICELAESSPNRQMKVAACELLHALVLVMIGNSAFQARDKWEPTPSRYHRIYVRLFPVLLRLAIDIDQVARDMFRTLIAQLIHWLTNNAQYENPETIALLQTCLDAACDSNAALRDYGADCIQEFVKWSIKQTSIQAKENPMNIKSLLKRLYNMASNPSSMQRLGAAIIFNRIYRIFREEASLVDEFTFELLYWMFFSLRLAEDDHPSIGTRDQIKESISHLKRILRVKSSVFQKETPIRRVFSGIERADMSSLVEWSFRQTGQLQRDYAKTCMNFFTEFVLSLPGVSSAKEWLNRALSSKPKLLVDIYEREKLQIQATQSNDSIQSRIIWMKQLNCALDGYVWLLERQMVDAMQILEQKSSNLIEAALQVINTDVLDSISGEGYVSTVDVIRVQGLHAYATYRIICLLYAIATSPQSDDALTFLEEAGLLLKQRLADAVARMLLQPEHFVEAVQAEQGALSMWLSSKNIRYITKKFVGAMNDFGPPRFIRKLAKSASTIIFRENVDLAELDMDRSALNDMMQMLEGIMALQSFDLLDIVCKQNPKFGNVKAGSQYCQELFNKYNALNVTDEPAWIDLLGGMARIAFDYPGFAKEHGQDLVIKPFATDTERATIYQRFNCHINDIIATHFKDFGLLLIANLGEALVQDVILGLVAHLKAEKQSHRKEVSSFIDDLINGTTFLTDLINAWKTPSKLPDLVTFMIDLFAIEPGIVLRSKNEPIFDTLCDALKLFLAQDIPLSLKIDAFDLLPVYICAEESSMDSVADLIKETVNRQISVYLMDSDTNISAYSECVSALDKLLEIMSKFHSTRMFNFLLPVFIQSNKESERSANIERHIGIFAKGLDLHMFEQVTQACFGHYQDEHLDMKMRKNAVKLVVSLLSQVPNDYVVEFYKANIVFIMRSAKAELLRRGTDEEVICDMEEKSCCFLLMQTLYERLPASKVHGPESQIAKVWEEAENKSGEGRKMTIDLVGMAHNAKSKKSPHESENVAKARLRYHQAAYNAAAAAILRTQKNEKFFVGFLIHQKPAEPLWENIVDTSESVNLLVELTQPLMKTRLEDFRAASGLRAPTQSNGGVSYMASIRLSGSSLSQASLSDMALEASGRSPPAVSPSTSIEPEGPTPEQEERELAEDVISSPNEMEVDQFNSNPCMDFLIKIIRRLHTTITPPTKDTSKMPLWMNELHKVFQAHDTPLIIKLFLAKLIINCPEAFESYASHWIRPLMKLVTIGDQYGDPMNYFVQDICVLLIVWGRNVGLDSSYDDRVLTHKFISYLMRNAYHETARILKNNIQTIKGVFDNWHQQIIVPTKILLEQFSDKAEDSKKNRVGLQLTGIVLAHNLDPLYIGPEVELGDLTEQRFFSSLCDNLRNKYRDVYADAAEVAGWYISYMKSQGKQVDWFENTLIAKLKSMDPLIRQSGDDTRFLICLHRIHLHELSIPQKFITKVCFLMPRLYGDIKVVALQLIASYADSIGGLFTSLMSFGLPKMIKSRNDEWQLTLLKLLNKLCPQQGPSDIEQILDPLVSTFSSHPSKECRVLYYSILRGVFDNLMDTSELKDHIKALLLRGLVDPAEDVRKSLTSYLQTRFELSNNIYERLKGIIHNMYDPEVENIFILYSTQMILEATKSSYDYDKPIFDEPLPNAKFDENYQAINTSWQRNMSMTPLFVATQERSQMDPEELESRVRATQQSLAFSQTQTGAGASLAATFAPSQTLGATSLSNSAASESQAVVDQYRQAVGRRGGGAGTLSGLENAYTGLRRRFIKTTETDTAAFFRRQQDRLQRRLKRYEMLQKQAREKKVTLYRKYRAGELPDIQIKYMDLLVPLQALGCNDNEIARLLHTKVVVSIANDAQRNGRMGDYNKELLQDIEDNLQRSTRYFSPAIGSLIRICYELSGKPSVSSDIISSVSQKSYNEHIGIAFLEKKLEQGSAEAEQQSASKKARTKQCHKLVGDKKLWSDLANLYKSIDEPEIFQSLYQLHVASFQEPKDAINAEIRGAYADAIARFTDAAVEHNVEADQIEAALWSQELIHCYEQLTDWQSISDEMLDVFEGDLDRAWSNENKAQYVGHIMRSFTKLRLGSLDEAEELIPWTSERPNPLFKFLSSAVNHPDRLEYLLEHHACDVSLADIYQEDYDRARFNIRHSYDSFLSTWTSLHPLAHGSRMSRLAVLERTVELEDFLDIVGDIQKNDYSKDKIRKYIRTLSSRYPESRLDSMDIWDDIVYSRNVFLDDLKRLLNGSQFLTEIDSSILGCRKAIGMTMAEAAREQNNASVSRKCIKDLTQLGLGPHEKTSLLLQTELQAILVLQDAQTRLQRTSRQLLKVDRYESDIQLHDTDYLLMAAKFHDLARSDLSKSLASFNSLRGIQAVETLCNMRNIKNAGQFINYLTQNGYDLLQDAIKKSEQEGAKQAVCVWRLAEYCDAVLRSVEESENTGIKVNMNQYARVVIDNCFKAMNLENEQAIEKFPRLLELIERYPETAGEFKSNAESFEPVWIYIRWIPQMVATLDRPEALNVFPALHKLAKTYPAALYYPFNISNEHYLGLGDKLNKANKAEIEKLRSELKSPLLSRFCNELRRLTNPEHIVKDFIDFCQSICTQSDLSKEYIQAMYEQFNDLLLKPQSDQLGAIPKAFAVKHAAQLREFLGKDGSKLTKLSSRDISKMIDYYKKQIADPKHAAPGLLKSYSPWLANFQSADYDEQLEIPGQYTGSSRPQPELHAKITSFDERVLVMSSIRKPKRIQIYGSDEKKYYFLVKGGEDLRLDQRIEQLFEVMNQILKKDAYCARQNILINTYKVVPMSTNIGLIEWVSDTKPLRSCIDERPEDKLSINKATEAYRTYISRFKGGMMGYSNMFKASRDQVVPRFQQICKTLRTNILRNYLYKLAISPEAFLYIRKQFINSLAAICISGYLLGIGDRHLDNFLVDLKSGKLVPIDFGHAFGSATELLPVPELIPFRMTNQLLGVVEPLGIDCTLLVTMANILRAIQLQKDVLLNTMDIFIKEPLLDWRKQAVKQAANQKHSASANSSTAIDSIAWYPQEKIENARRKLSGENPSYTVLRELGRNTGIDKTARESLEKAVRGAPSINIRAVISEQTADAKQQVQCLLDQATDANLLGRLWVGWQSFV